MNKSIYGMNHSDRYKSELDPADELTQAEQAAIAAEMALPDEVRRELSKARWLAEQQAAANRKAGAEYVAKLDAEARRPVVTGNYLLTKMLETPLYVYGGDIHEVSSTPAGDTSRNDEIPF